MTEVNEEQAVEWEVLESIYGEDPDYKKLSDTRLQYKFNNDSEDKKFLIEIAWPPQYPEVIPIINLDVFYNSHIGDHTRQTIKQKLEDVAKENEGMAVSFTLIEHVKENLAEFTVDWELKHASDTIGELRQDDAKIAQPKEVLTKAAKRRIWDKVEAGTSATDRGSDWVDILKHLSQTRDN